MENVQYFEIIPDKSFERRFQVNGVEYLVKYTGYKKSEGYSVNYNSQYMLAIEIKSDISFFMKIKIYQGKDGICVYKQSSVLQAGQTRLEANLVNFIYGSYPFICSVKVARYQKWQNTVDSAQKMNPTKNVTSSKSPRIESRLDDLSSDMKRLLEQGELSDVILIAGSKEFRAHKLILSARSKVFSKMFQHSMKEMRENRVTITDVPSEVLKELLTFIYTGVVTVKDMKMSRDLYVAADKYDVKELRAVCSKQLKDVDRDSVLDTLTLADLYGDQSLKQSALDYISENSGAQALERWGSFRKENPVLATEVLRSIVSKRSLIT